MHEVHDDLVREADLDFSCFRCCGDENLHPFRCSSCGRIMVFCYECESLYEELRDLGRPHRDLNHSDRSQPIFACPNCSHAFEYDFMESRAYDVPRSEWLRAGLGELLRR